MPDVGVVDAVNAVYQVYDAIDAVAVRERLEVADVEDLARVLEVSAPAEGLEARPEERVQLERLGVALVGPGRPLRLGEDRGEELEGEGRRVAHLGHEVFDGQLLPRVQGVPDEDGLRLGKPEKR